MPTPPPRDQSALVRQLSLVNAVLCCAAVVFALELQLESAVAALGETGHWPSGRRDVTVVDRTGSRGWREATRWAVEQWNAAGADVRLVWASGAGPCEPGEAGIGVCLGTQADIGPGIEGLQGLADPTVERDLHTSAVTVLLCSDCRVDAARRRVIATHELGHALGLEHTERPTSVMYHTGGSATPDAADRQVLRYLYAHVDEGPCGLLGLRLGPACI